MKGSLSGVALMLLSVGASATQLQISNIDYLYPDSTITQYRLPWFSSPDNPIAAKRINDHLFSTFIFHLPGKDPQATLNQLAKTEHGLEGIETLDYHVQYMGKNILAIDILGEWCGAYCEAYTEPVVFDLSTGYRVTLEQIITNNGMDTLATKVRKDISDKISTFVSQQKALPAEKQRDEDGVIMDYEAFYAECLARTKNPDFTDYTDRYSLNEKNITFLNGRCSNHANQALDDLGDFQTPLPVSSLNEMLTPYGKTLLTNEPRQRTAPLPGLSDRVLYGTLGKNTRIVLNVSCQRSYIQGAYFYEKYGAAIGLSGKCSPENTQHYELTTSSNEAPAEKIVLDLKEGRYQGNWQSGGKTLPVQFD